MDKRAWVRIDVENLGKDTLSIEVNDTIPEEFKLCDGENLNWRYNITLGERVRYSYLMKPTRPGIFAVPRATATFSVNGKRANITSKNCTIAVDGAYVLVNKTAQPSRVKADENVTVIVTATNTGNRDAIVELTDLIPANARVINGNTTMHATLSEGETSTIRYTIIFNSTAKIMLEPPEVAVTCSGYSRVATSGMPVIEITDTAGADLTPDDRNNATSTPEAQNPTHRDCQ